MAAAFNSEAFSPMHQRGGFTRWMHYSTSQIGDMARNGYFDQALAEGYPVKPGHLIDVLAGRGGATPRSGQFVVDDITNGRITVNARNMGQIANAGDRFFGLPTDNNTPYFKDMLDNPGIYSVPVGNWRIPDMSGYRIEPGVRTFIGVDPNHCVLDFSETTAKAMTLLALGTGYKFRFVNVGLKGTGLARFFDVEDWVLSQLASGVTLPFDSLVIDEFLLDNVEADLWDTLFHGDQGYGALSGEAPPLGPEVGEVSASHGTGALGNFLTIAKTTVRDSKFTNFHDCPLEFEMGRILDAQYLGNFYGTMGQNAIANGFIGSSDAGRQIAVQAPGIQGSDAASGDITVPDPASSQHPIGDNSTCLVNANIFNRVGIIGDTIQPPGARSTSAVKVFGDRIVVSNNMIGLHEATSANDTEGIRGAGMGVSVTGNHLFNAGLSAGFIRVAGPPPDETLFNAGQNPGQIGPVLIAGNTLINTRFGSGSSVYASVAAINVDHALAIIDSNYLEGFTKNPIRCVADNSAYKNSTERFPAVIVSRNLLRKCGLRGGTAATQGIVIGISHTNLQVIENTFERCYGNDTNPGMIRIAVNPESLAPGILIPNSYHVVRGNRFFWDNPELEGEDRECIRYIFSEPPSGAETTKGILIADNVSNLCDTFLTLIGGTNATIDKFTLANNDAEWVDDFLDISGLVATLTNSRISGNPGYLDGSKTHDFGTVNAGTTATTTLTITDAVAGDVVRLRETSGGLAAGLLLSGQVTAANTVTLSCHNVTAGNIAVGSLTYDVFVERRRNPS